MHHTIDACWVKKLIDWHRPFFHWRSWSNLKQFAVVLTMRDWKTHKHARRGFWKHLVHFYFWEICIFKASAVPRARFDCGGIYIIGYLFSQAGAKLHNLMHSCVTPGNALIRWMLLAVYFCMKGLCMFPENVLLLWSMQSISGQNHILWSWCERQMLWFLRQTDRTGERSVSADHSWRSLCYCGWMSEKGC